ncbi:EVE domain-containing protein [Gemmobacter denitrificans]|uniref:UPF0310 protein V6590_04155 n=1 Tax=Gemmobacter denitrificans TaxID=3123040 RepID=A0ABU8BST3_9RHOB
MPHTETRYWVVTASADHAARGQEWGIVQACHGKAAPLRRMRPGDGVVIYSPRDRFPAGQPLQAFTAIGRVGEGEPWQVDMGGGFTPWRRHVLWQPARPAAIQPLLGQLELTRWQSHWGMVFRYGLCTVTRADFIRIAQAMVVQPMDRAQPMGQAADQ